MTFGTIDVVTFPDALIFLRVQAPAGPDSWGVSIELTEGLDTIT